MGKSHGVGMEQVAYGGGMVTELIRMQNGQNGKYCQNIQSIRT